MVSMQDVASEPRLSREGSSCWEVSPGCPELSLPFDNRLRGQADPEPGELWEVEPRVIEGSCSV